MKITIIISLILIWLVFGFIAFLMEAREGKITSFKGYVDEFEACLLFGVIAFLIMLFDEPFTNFMDFLMKKIQKK